MESDDENNLPDAASLLRTDGEKKKREEEARQRQNLASLKQRALERSRMANQSGSLTQDEDDDLEVVEIDEEKKPKSTVKVGVSGKNIQLARIMQVPRRSTKKEPGSGLNDKECFELAAKPDFGPRKRRGGRPSMTQDGLKAMLLDSVSRQGQLLREEREREWVSRGGRLKDRDLVTDEVGNRLQDAFSIAIRKGSKTEQEVDEEEEGSDGEYLPDERGSASPAPALQESDVETEASEEGDEAGVEDNDVEETESHLLQDTGDTDDSPNEEPSLTRRSRTFHRPSRVVDSDSENDENMVPRSLGRVLVPDTSFIEDPARIQNRALARKASLSSMDDASPNEDDKENDTSLMFVQDEDKENTAVSRHISFGRSSERPGLGSRQNSGLFELVEGVKRNMSMSPHSNDIDMNLGRNRKRTPARTSNASDDPFSVLPSAPFAPHRSDMTTVSEGTKVGSQSDTRFTSLSPRPLQPAFGESAGGFSQFFNDDDGFIPNEENDENAPPRAVVPAGFGELLGSMSVPSRQSVSTQPRPMEVGGFSQLFSLDEVRYDSPWKPCFRLTVEIVKYCQSHQAARRCRRTVVDFGHEITTSSRSVVANSPTSGRHFRERTELRA